MVDITIVFMGFKNQFITEGGTILYIPFLNTLEAPLDAAVASAPGPTEPAWFPSLVYGRRPHLPHSSSSFLAIFTASKNMVSVTSQTFRSPHHQSWTSASTTRHGFQATVQRPRAPTVCPPKNQIAADRSIKSQSLLHQNPSQCPSPTK